ncbi:MAG: hypothetical protein ACI9KM_000665, partial [Rubritalea sp.]
CLKLNLEPELRRKCGNIKSSANIDKTNAGNLNTGKD